ncbi:MAG: hypothetical protein ACE14S_08990 [Candidatus Bathyarchaeia archaeon]
MKLVPSNRVLAVLFIGVLAFSAVNTYLIFYRTDELQRQLQQQIDQNHAALTVLTERLDQVNQVLMQVNAALNQLNQTDMDLQRQTDLLNGKIDNLNARLPIEQYDYAIYRNGDEVEAKNGKTGVVDFRSRDAASVFRQALDSGNTVYVKSGEYTLSSDVSLTNKKNARLDSDGASLFLNGARILIVGDNYAQSQYNQISGFRIVSGTVRIENSFRTTITNMIFENCSVALELANTRNWTEGTEVDTVHFNKCVQGIVFRTNTTGATGSYTNTEVSRCYFNLLDSSVAVTVERNAEFTDSQMRNVRIWMGEFGRFNQTGLLLDGSMYETLLDGVVFESFASSPLDNALFYAVSVGRTAYQAPVMQAGVNFLGSWTARVYNPYGAWIYGVGGVFKQENVLVTDIGSFGSYGQPIVIQMRPATISSFKPRVTVQGSFGSNETVTVRFRLEFVDNSVTRVGESVEKQFNNSASVWLDDSDLMRLFPSQNVIWAVLVDAKVNAASTDATVRVDIYGTTA